MTKVLVVDDSSIMRAFISEALSDSGEVETVEAASGFEALRELPRNHFALVVTDINMPDINGLELLHFIRSSQEHRHTPVLVVSTENTEEDVKRAMAAGASAYLIKPFTPEAIVNMAESLISEAPGG